MQRSAKFPIVETASGVVRGRRENGISAFLNIPFAEPPVGERWLMEPQPVARWEGVLDALDYGPTAPQPVRGPQLIPEPVVPGDSYLNLNIWAPHGAKLPVLVFIHGGVYFAGSNRSPWFAGNTFARDGIVFVGINYRLGFEGFMDVEDAPSSRGVRDWIAALKWVRANIAAFGGDPGRVTIAGQSAGAGACATLLALPAARGLFHGAILQSGSVGFGGSRELTSGFQKRFTKLLRVKPTRAGLASKPHSKRMDAQMAAGTDVPAGPVMDVVEWFGGGLSIQPTVDGALVPEMPAQTILDGKGSDVPVLTSSTAEEFDFLFGPLAGEFNAAVLDRAFTGFGFAPGAARAYRKAYPRLPLWQLAGKALTDRIFRLPAIRMAEARAEQGAKTFVAEFRWRPDDLPDGGLRSAHCLDIPFAFDLLGAERVDELAGSHPPQSLARDVHATWVRFVKTGKPGWPAYRTSKRSVRYFDKPSATVDDPHGIERRLLTGWPAPRA